MSTPADELASRFDPIALAAVNARAALESRVDRKYVVAWEVVEQLAERLRETHAILEIGGARTFGYRTLYYDSDALASYRAHVQGRRRRFKARVREYVESGRVRVEVKTKGRRGETVKRWTDESDLSAFARTVVADAYGLAVAGELEPSLVTVYRRLTLAARESAERVTIDYDLSFETPAGVAASLRDGHAIVESKSPRGRGIADRVLRELGARPVRVSKYVIGVGLTRGAVPAELRPLARRYFAGVGTLT